MSTYSNRLQPALQNLLQRVVQFFHPRSSCPMHIFADVCGGRKSFVKPVTWHNISSCSVLSPEIVMHDDAYIGGHSENNIKCIVHDDLGWKNRTTLYILPHQWLYKWFSQCGTYSVLSWSPSFVFLPALSIVNGCSPYFHRDNKCVVSSSEVVIVQAVMWISNLHLFLLSVHSFSALTLLVGWQEGHRSWKKVDCCYAVGGGLEVIWL